MQCELYVPSEMRSSAARQKLYIVCMTRGGKRYTTLIVYSKSVLLGRWASLSSHKDEIRDLGLYRLPNIFKKAMTALVL
jgi:hypothetical protein